MATFLGVAPPFAGVPGRPACARAAVLAVLWAVTGEAAGFARPRGGGSRRGRRTVAQAARRSTRRPRRAGSGEGVRNSMAGRIVPPGRARTPVGLCGNALENQGAAPKLLAVTGSRSPESVIIRR